MLRLHIIGGDLVLFSLVIEINEYARYAYQGKHNEHSHMLGHCGCDGHVSLLGLLLHEKLLIRTWGAMRHLQPRCERCARGAVRQPDAGTLHATTTVL